MTEKNLQSSDLIRLLESWYTTECNGDWEHTYGITIETLDNPGWLLKVDLNETTWSELRLPIEIDQRSEDDWIQTEVKDSKFLGCGGPGNLNELIARFLELVNNIESLST